MSVLQLLACLLAELRRVRWPSEQHEKILRRGVVLGTGGEDREEHEQARQSDRFHAEQDITEKILSCPPHLHPGRSVMIQLRPTVIE